MTRMLRRRILVRVLLLLAYTPHLDSQPDYLPELSSSISRDDMLRYLEDTAAPLRSRGLSVATEVLKHASAPAAIADYAAQHGGALVAMTTSGAGAMRRLLLGSVADKVTDAYRRHLYGDATLQDLPADADGPRTATPVTIGQVAATCGYYDQAHLVRDFREFAGQSPSEYFRKENQLSSWVLDLATNGDSLETATRRRECTS